MGIGEQDAGVLSRVVYLRYIFKDENSLSWESCNALVVFIYFIKYRVYLIELFYLCDLLMFI